MPSRSEMSIMDGRCNIIMNGSNAELSRSEMSIGSDSTHLTALDNWSTGDLEDRYTISSDFSASLDSNSYTNLSQPDVEGFHDAIAARLPGRTDNKVKNF